MPAEAWLSLAAERMWGRIEVDLTRFPRDPARLARYGFRIVLKQMPGLSLEGVRQWFSSRSLPVLLEGSERGLHGLLVEAAGGRIYVFTDPVRDSQELQRFTLAHELAHLWLEVLEPRERLIKILGPRTREIFSCGRTPTPAERVQAALWGLSLRPAVHLLARDVDGGVDDPGVGRAEARADRLALELLAPAEVAEGLVPPAMAWQPWLGAATDVLITTFGLPELQARRYAKELAPSLDIGPSFWERWGMPRRS